MTSRSLLLFLPSPDSVRFLRTLVLMSFQLSLPFIFVRSPTPMSSLSHPFFFPFPRSSLRCIVGIVLLQEYCSAGWIFTFSIFRGLCIFPPSRNLPLFFPSTRRENLLTRLLSFDLSLWLPAYQSCFSASINLVYSFFFGVRLHSLSQPGRFPPWSVYSWSNSLSFFVQFG